MSYELIKKAVFDQLGDDAKQELENVRACPDGAAGGFGGFIYYNETRKFAKDNMKAIYNYAKEQALDCGQDVFEMIQGFGCLRDINPLTSEIADTIHGHPDNATMNDGVDTQILNALAWFALESVAHREEK
jgi:hypothetical protein